MRPILLLLAILLAGCAEKAVVAPKQSPKAPKITHFYGNSPIVSKGESVTLCYGTENVDTVTMQPTDDPALQPSFNRCIAHAPVKDTTYVLTAKGPGGETSAKFSVRIGQSAPKDRVLIQSFLLVGRTPIPAGAPAQLCYTTEGASAVSVQPAVSATLAAGRNQCFIVKPEKTTAYVLSAKAPDGSVDRMQVTVAVQ